MLKALTSHRIAKNSISLLALQFVTIVAPLVALPYLSRTLGVDGFGIIMLVFSASIIGVVFTDFGFSLAATYKISKNREDISFVSQLIGAVFLIKLALFVLLLLGVGGYHLVIGFSPLNLEVASYILLNILFQSFIPTWFFQGIERMKNITIYMVSAKLIFVLMIFLFIDTKEDVGLVVVFLALSNFLALSIAFLSIYKNGYFVRAPSLKLIFITFKESLPFFLSRFSVTVYTSASTFIVGSFAGVQQAAIYGASEKFYQAFQSVTTPISQAIFPYMAQKKNEKLLLLIILCIGAPLMLCLSFVWIWAYELVEFIFGADFYQAGSILRVFLITTIFSFISVNLGYPAFAGLGKVHIANYTVMIGAAVQALCLSILIYQNIIDAYSIVISVLFTEFVVALLRFYLYMRIRKNV